MRIDRLICRAQEEFSKKGGKMGQRFISVFTFLLLICAVTGLFSQGNQTIINLPANSWYKAPNSKMRPFCPATASGYGCGCIMTAWNGGAYNPVGRELIVFGGGHNDYDGNEVYAFSVDSLKWRRVTNPSYPSNRCNNVNSDNTPVSRHSYSGLGFITHANRFFALGGALDCAGGGCGANETWTFSVTAKQWYRMQPSGTTPSTGCGDNCCYDPASQKLYFHTGSGLHAYNFTANSWALANGDNNSYYRTTCVDTKRRLIVEIGGGSINTFNLAVPALTRAVLTTTGANTIINSSQLGMDYDAASDKIVAYSAGRVYVLDMDTKVWTMNQPSGGPLNNTVNGTWGRWRYAPDVNAFVLAVDVDSSVYFYKLTAGSGIEKGALRNMAQCALSISPNPFNRQTTIAIHEPFKGSRDISLAVYDMQGGIVDNLTAGMANHEARWNADKVSGGIYLVVLKSGGHTVSSKCLIIK
jgi:hypothetical protein